MDTSLEKFGVEEVLNPRRRVDWVEPWPEGDHLLETAPAGDKDDQ